MRAALLSVMVVIVFSTPCLSQIVDKIVAVVNGEVITLYDLKKEMSQEALISPSATKENKDLLSRTLNNMINNLLFKQEAKRLKITASDFEVEREFNQILKESNITEDELKTQLKKEGMTEKEFKQRIKDNIIINKLLSVMVKQKVVVTEEEVKHYYNSHKDKFTIPPMLHIIMYSSPQRMRIESLSTKKIKKGNLKGIEVSDMGFVRVSSLQKRWRDALQGLHKGMFSSMFKIGNQYVKFFIADEKEKTLVPLSKVEDKIKMYLRRKKLKALYEDYVKKLRAKAIIKIMI